MEHKHFALTHITYPTNNPLAPLLALLSLTPPFAICSLTTSILLHKDVLAAYLLIGLLLCTATCSLLKRIIGQPRPVRYDDDDGIEYGMPSNHSAFVWFAATFIILCLKQRGESPSKWWHLPSRVHYLHNRDNSLHRERIHNKETSIFYFNAEQWTILTKLWSFLHNQIVIVTCLIIAIGCTYSRVYLGYHTPHQVYAGCGLGIVLGMIWYRLLETRCVGRILICLDEILVELERCRCGHYFGTNEMSNGNGKGD